MVDMMQFDFVLFEWNFVFVLVCEVCLFGVEGDFSVMFGYVLVIVNLCFGLVIVVVVDGIEM